MTFDQLLNYAKCAFGKLASSSGSRVASYCEQAVGLLDQWAKIRTAERHGDLRELEALEYL